MKTVSEIAQTLRAIWPSDTDYKLEHLARILEAIAQHNRRPFELTEGGSLRLAQRTGVSKATTAYAVQRLMRAGLIDAPNSTNPERRKLRATDQGKRVTNAK